jgi:hypothetical protein
MSEDRPRARRRDEDDDYEDDDRPRRGKSRVPCPKCGSRSIRSGPWPWYLGTVGAMLCDAKICKDCEHEFDAKKPDADLAKRKLMLALVINGIGFIGIIAVLGLLYLVITASRP